MRKPTAIIAALVLSSIGLSGCAASDPADTYDSFSSKFTSAFNKSVELSNSGDFFYTSEVSSGLARNTIYKDGSSVSIFDGDSTTPSCPVQFDLVNSYKVDTKPIPLQAFTKETTAEGILASMKAFSSTANNAAWIVKSDRLYMITEASGNVNIVGILLNENGSIDYYMGITGGSDFATTVKNVTNDTNTNFNSPNVLVMYAYGDRTDIAISDNLGIDFKWWLKNYKLIADKDINKLAEFDAEGNLVKAPVMTKDKAVLLVNVSESGLYTFYNADSTPYLFKGKQLTCQEGK